LAHIPGASLFSHRLPRGNRDPGPGFVKTWKMRKKMTAASSSFCNTSC